MSVDNTIFAERQGQPAQVAGEIERLHDEWRGVCQQLAAARERQSSLRASLAEQDALVAGLASSERRLRTRLHMRLVLARLPIPEREQPAVEVSGVCRPVSILGVEDDDGGRYSFRADGSFPDIYRIRDKKLKSYAHIGGDEAAARERLAELRAAETPARRPVLPLLSSLARRAWRFVTG